MKILELNQVLLNSGEESNISKIDKAYEFAKKAHKGQNRLTGEPFVEHCLRTALILAKLNLDIPTIVTAILHDVVSKTDVTIEQVKDNFGEEIANLVEGVTQVGTIKELGKEESQAEMVRKVILASVKDIRVILVKLAERVDNMETIDVLPEQRRKRIAKDVMEVYAPIAHKLGIAKIKWRLEDLAFRQLEPDAFFDIQENIEANHDARESEIRKIEFDLKRELMKHKFKFEISGRPKHLYSIHKKMKRKRQAFDDIYDLRALRIITDSVGHCYEILGVIHNLWTPIPREFDDYIANPKLNMYQSLHTVVIGPTQKAVEIQIRTKDMHTVAEAGIAAHWKYKGIKSEGDMDHKLSWMKELGEWQKQSQDAQEFLKILKVDFFQDQIFTFTPNGRVIEMPKDSTVLDFAFAVHSELGLKSVGGKVNSRFVSLRTKLKNGDLVEIVTSKTQKPSRQWLKFVRTTKAKTKIKQFIRANEDIPVKSLSNEQDVKKEFEAWIIDVDNMVKPEIKLARCCKPLPGNKISGFATLTDKVSIHTLKCPVSEKYKASSRRRKVNVSWVENIQSTVDVHVEAIDRIGLFAEILNALLAIKIQIKNANARPIGMGRVECSFSMEVASTAELQDTIQRIKRINGVQQVYIASSS
jgi:GTP diphosphokinase / guanosine-3',5'-bis(diphosphate) 3'-diphosphatase